MSRAADVTMTPAEVRAFLDSEGTVTFGSIGEDALPHLVALWFVRDGDDLITWTYATSQKVRNLERDPRAALMVEGGTAYTELRGVALDCTVEIVRDPGAVLSWGQRLNARHLPDAPAGSVQAQAAKRVALIASPVRFRSWDHRKLPRPRVA